MKTLNLENMGKYGKCEGHRLAALLPEAFASILVPIYFPHFWKAPKIWKIWKMCNPGKRFEIWKIRKCKENVWKHMKIL